jgi:adenosylmethionine-8-amino-7-oxononanoate aminotransferase
MCAVEFVKDKGTKVEFPMEEKVASRVHVAAQKRGLMSRIRGESVYSLAPPVVTPFPVLDRIVEALAGAVHEILG